MAHIKKSKLKKWSRRITDRAREIVEFNLHNPMVRDDAREELPRANIKNRGMKIDPNTLLVVHLRHHRPALFWDATISWKKLPPVSPENLSEWSYDLFRLVMFEEEIKAGEWDFMPSGMQTPMVTVVAPYMAQPCEAEQYNELVRERGDHEKFNVGRLMGTVKTVHPDGAIDTPQGNQIVIPSRDQIRQLT